jgi:hypothetical protein
MKQSLLDTFHVRPQPAWESEKFPPSQAAIGCAAVCCNATNSAAAAGRAFGRSGLFLAFQTHRHQWIAFQRVSK